jgi:hypothetical protein
MNQNMDCTAARELMLEAELDELSGNPDTPLTRHIAGCAECATIARTLLQGYSDLDAGLTQLTHGRTPNVLPFRKRRAVWSLVPLAAAAVLAMLMLRSGDERLPPPPTQLAQLMFPEEAVVTPPPGQQAVVIEKPGLTVVWLY